MFKKKFTSLMLARAYCL